MAGAAAAIARVSSQPVVLLLLGNKNALPVEVPLVERTVTPGYLDERSLARALAAADLFLAPFSDGASTRRGSLMAALQHGVATITTRSDKTEAALADSNAMVLTPAGDAASFARQAAVVAADATLRRTHAIAGQQLYERCFSWPVVCVRLRDVISTR